MFKLNMLKWYHRFINKKLPKYFLDFEIKAQKEIHDHDTKSKDTIPPPVPRLHSSRRCIRNYISIVINSMPKLVIDKVHTHSLKGFSLYTKNYILSTYDTTCVIENCYSCSRTWVYKIPYGSWYLRDLLYNEKDICHIFAVWLAWDFGVLYGSSVVRDVWGSIVRRCVCVHVKYLVAELFFLYFLESN